MASLKLIIVYSIIFCATSSCRVSSELSRIKSDSFHFDEWKERFIAKISDELKALTDTLPLLYKKEYGYLLSDIDREKSERFLSRHDSALQKLGPIPSGASTYFVEYYLEGETLMSDYGMFWIDGDQYKGIRQNEKWEWNFITTKHENLEEIIKFQTDLNEEELIVSGRGHILITKFKGNKTIDVNFAALISLPQFIIANDIFSSQQPFKLK